MAKSTGLGQLLYSEGNDISNDIESHVRFSTRESLPALGVNRSAIDATGIRYGKASRANVLRQLGLRAVGAEDAIASRRGAENMASAV